MKRNLPQTTIRMDNPSRGSCSYLLNTYGSFTTEDLDISRRVGGDNPRLDAMRDSTSAIKFVAQDIDACASVRLKRCQVPGWRLSEVRQ